MSVEWVGEGGQNGLRRRCPTIMGLVKFQIIIKREILNCGLIGCFIFKLKIKIMG